MTIEDNDALIVVDMQNDFFHGGAMPVEGADRVVPLVNRLIHSFDLAYFTRDWHPQDHCSFEDDPSHEHGSWPEHCVQYSPGAEFHGSLHVPMDCKVISKGTDSEREDYSGFSNPELDADLKRRGITRVFVCGIAADFGVKATALDAREAGYQTVLLADATRGVSEESAAEAIAEMESDGVEVAETSDIL